MRYPPKRLGLSNIENILAGHLSFPRIPPKYWMNPKIIAIPHPKINRKYIRFKTLFFLIKFVTNEKEKYSF